MPSGVGVPSRTTLGFGCLFADLNLDGALDLIVANGHIDGSVRDVRSNVAYAQAPHLFRNSGSGHFQDVASQAGDSFGAPKVARGLACGDFDRDGDLDVLMTTNGGAAYLYRNDTKTGNHCVRFHLRGTKSNRDAIGAVVRILDASAAQSRIVRGGSSYLSQSELSLTFGTERREMVERAIIEWPSGYTQEFKNLRTGRSYACVEGHRIRPLDGF